MFCSHIHAEPLRERLKGLNQQGVKTPFTLGPHERGSHEFWPICEHSKRSQTPQ